MEMLENEKLENLVSAVFTLEANKGHLKWSVAELARSCEVSRPLVYYHLGRNKREILFACLDIVASEFYGLNPKRTDMVRKGNLLESLKHTRRMYDKTPALTIFYLRWSTRKSDIQSKLADIDRQYRQRLLSLFPHLTVEQAVAVQAVFHGLVTAPNLSENTLIEVLKWLPLKPR